MSAVVSLWRIATETRDYKASDLTGRGAAKWKLAKREAVMRVTADHLDSVLHPQFEGHGKVLAKGLAASPGAAVGKVYFTADDAVDAADRGEKVVLVRNETSPEDVHGMMVAEGILTARGGLVSHAAGFRVFKGTLDKHPTVARIVGKCLEDDRFARAQPLRQPGAPAAN